MDTNNNEIKNLQNRINILEKENEYLKSLLESAGIEYHSKADSFDSDQISNNNSHILPIKVDFNHARVFFSYFWGRTDVYSKRFKNKNTGKTGYFPQCRNFWKYNVCPKSSGNKIKCTECSHREWIELGAKQIEDHLNGMKEDSSDVIGIYPLFPDGTCRLIVFDFDNHEKSAEQQDYANIDDLWKEEVNALRSICRLNNIPVLTERSRSGRGAHLWIFFQKPISASIARKFGFALLEKGTESVNLKTFKYYDRILPAQDNIPDSGLGNLIALPLQGQALKEGNSAFIDENWNAYPDQWKALIETKKISEEQLTNLLEEWNGNIGNKISSETEHDPTKPWEKNKVFDKSDVDGKINITLSNMIYISTSNLKPRIQNKIRRLAAFSNPAYFKNQAMGLSNYANSRFIYLGEDDGNYICIPRGLIDTLTEKCTNAGIDFKISDKRCTGHNINVSFNGQLRDNQEAAVNKLLCYDIGILSAATAFGKTVVCSNIISRYKVNTLILLESSALIEQWENALKNFLIIDEELPEYKTASGRIRKRKNIIGKIKGTHDSSTGIIDIAMVGSLFKNDEPHRMLKNYGMIIVDECHHSASDTFRKVFREVCAKYVYGVTATPFRGDGLEKIIYMNLGSIRFQYSAKDKAAEQGIDHIIIPRFTRAVCPRSANKMHINDAYELIRDNQLRNEQIISDVIECIENNRTPVVLTKYKEHAEMFYKKLLSKAKHVFLLTGSKSVKEQQYIRSEMNSVPACDSLILIATGQFIGEGFDFPRLDTLIMASPVAWKGIVEQYAGRLNRDYAGKKNVIIYDYVDSHIPVFERMYMKRLKAYKRIGYSLCSNSVSDKQEANFIYDSDNYFTVFERDLKEAVKEIVISSPTLGKAKVMKIISLIKKQQESGVKITILTWHPDKYKYGRDEHRIELLETLKNTGFDVRFMEENCERYAIIDNEIVWYGSMNLLSKDDADDNIMRVVSREIADELLIMTVGKYQHVTDLGDIIFDEQF